MSQIPVRWTVAMLALAACLCAADVPSPALLVLNKEGALAIVNPATKQVVARVRTGDSPHETVASDEGKLAFVSNYGSSTPGNTISVIDLAAQKEIHRVDLGPLRRPHGLAFAGGKLYFTCETNKIIGRYDPATNKVDFLLGTGQTGTHMVALNSDQSQIYAANIGGNSISIFDRAGALDWNQTVIPVGKGPEGFDVTPDGKEIWAAHSRDGGVSIINIFTKSVTHTFGVQTKRSNRLRFTPDGRLVLISDLDAGELVILEHATRKELKRMPLGKELAGILITPDSRRAYVAVTGDNNVAVVDLKSLELIDRLQTGTGPDGMAWVK
ncbi:MAG TPA: YncE family protein [Candidatus Sulfopaludibacter sp.]|jgi:DNA-binding beta-propeller fold protein YncE|nr:YncE family protein [Candidatus Sulfopaludibacter sp.]